MTVTSVGDACRCRRRVLVTVTVVSVGVGDSDSDASVTSGVSVAIFMNFGLLPTKWEFLKLGWCLLSSSAAC